MKSQESGPSEPPEPGSGNLGPGSGIPEPGPAALSLRRERFCQAYARHGNAARAAREAGYASGFAKQRGHKLLMTAPVGARVEAIAAALDSEATRDSEAAAGDTRALIAKLEAVYRQALEGRAFHAAARAVELQARLGRRLAVPPATPGPTEEEPDLEALIAGAEASLRRVDADAGRDNGGGTDNGGAA
ncbi:MAG: terminase small subunit [Proteobacteria bacterium]|nr:terminase small subunit [Pseudomonadota bacterium]